MRDSMFSPFRVAPAASGNGVWWVSEIIPRFTKISEYLNFLQVIVFVFFNNASAQNFCPCTLPRAEK